MHLRDCGPDGFLQAILIGKFLQPGYPGPGSLLHCFNIEIGGGHSKRSSKQDCPWACVSWHWGLLRTLVLVLVDGRFLAAIGFVVTYSSS